jgi:hypothetical protein
MRLDDTRERGAAAVEAAFVALILVFLTVGAAEYGFAMQDHLAVTGASREGARVAAAAGDQPGADCRILEAAAGGLQSLDGDEVLEVRIYEANPISGNRMRYRPALAGDDPVKLKCGGGWFELENSWPEASRDNDGIVRDWVGVEIVFDHDWLTGALIFNGSACSRGTIVGVECWSQETTMHLEPDPTP